MEEKNTDEALFDRIKHLYDAWPSDGWDGAAQVIAEHAKKVRVVESELKLRHEASGKHGPEHPYYEGECACRGSRFLGKGK